jgi:hypothetical protein
VSSVATSGLERTRCPSVQCARAVVEIFGSMYTQALVQVKRATIEEVYAELHPELRSLIPSTVRPPMAEEDWTKFPAPDPKALARAQAQR